MSNSDFPLAYIRQTISQLDVDKIRCGSSIFEVFENRANAAQIPIKQLLGIKIQENSKLDPWVVEFYGKNKALLISGKFPV